jgi:GntR family transcriptional regulator
MTDPLYRRIADDLSQKIEAGELGGFDSNGDPEALPSESELGKRYGASRNTIRDAIKWLTNRRLIETRPGQGTYVVRIDPFVIHLNHRDGFGGGEGASYGSDLGKNRQPTVSVPRIEIQEAAASGVAEELQLAPDEQVLSRHQQRFIDGTPWSLQTTFYPKTLHDSGATRLLDAKDIPNGTVGYLQEALGIKEVSFRDELQVRAPNDAETKFFNVPEDGSVAMYETRHAGFDKDKNPFRLTVTIFPADRIRFVFEPNPPS